MLRGPTRGHTCPGNPTGPRLGRCSVLNSSSRPAWPPSTDHRGRGLLSPPSGLVCPASANLKTSALHPKNLTSRGPQARCQEAAHPAHHPALGPPRPSCKGQVPPCWGLTVSVPPHMEPVLQARSASVLSAIGRLCCFHPSLWQGCQAMRHEVVLPGDYQGSLWSEI